MKKILVITVILLFILTAMVYPYLKDLRTQGLSFEMAYDYFFSGPNHSFDPKIASPQLDYSKRSSWASLPFIEDEADFIPLGEKGINQLKSEVDVFFVHPTGYLKGEYWTDPLDEESATKENTRWMMANQASVFNACCSIFAPHYRQASIYSYFGSKELLEEVHAFAYQDVKKAFKYFLKNFSKGRPFIIASHSQGTHHSMRLLKEEIDGSELYSRMIAAYVIGGMVSKTQTQKLINISICESAAQLGCLVHWDTFNETYIDKNLPMYNDNVCVNPISWKNEGALSILSEAKGAVEISGIFSLDFSGDDSPKGVKFHPLKAPLKKYVQAQCKNGILFATDQTGTNFEGFAGSQGNYHGLDFALFYMDIRENAKLKVKTYLNQ